MDNLTGMTIIYGVKQLHYHIVYVLFLELSMRLSLPKVV